MAIARDANTTATNNATTGLTTAHTTSGSDRAIFVFISDLAGTTDRVSGVTYAGAAMSRINAVVNGPHGSQYLYGLLAPASGANNIVTSYTASILARENHSSYTGVSQSGLPDSQNTGTTTSTSPLTVSTTVVASGCWLVGGANSDPTALAAGTGTSVVNQLDGNYNIFLDSNATVGTGSQSLQVTWTSGNNNAILLVASIAPTAAPSSIKTINGLAKASVKTVNGLAIASVKTYNGLA